LNTQARLLLLLARRWSDGVLVFAPCGSEASPLSTAALTAASLAGGGRRDGVKCQVLTDLHGEMLVQVVMTASPDSLEQPSVDALVKHLQAHQIPCGVYYPIPLHLQKAYADTRYQESYFEVTNRLVQEVISLPMHTELDEEQMSFIAKTILEFLN